MDAPFHEFHETILKVENVSLTLGGKLILKDVCTEIRNVTRPGRKQGQVVSFLGPSGMGKTRLFRIIAGLDEPDEGQVLVGVDLKPVRKGSVGVVAQTYPLFENRTVQSNLVVAGKQGRHPNLDTAVKEMLERFGLAEHGDKYPAQLSGGQRQRVAIAQQFMCSEHFLLMDEPFSGLDVNAIASVTQMIDEISQTDDLKTIIVVTHDINAALEVADTIWVLGRDRDAAGEPIPGAKIVKTYDLIECGLAWRENIQDDPEFVRLNREIRELFKTL
jgi:polar amino acid transport system ATP-binding protein/sulfate transport system ATP-binding protein